ncbi:hypothetical protein N7488_002251 [Penicillium malachiteum]|nr:hypothetical protein N7488_002251 [Penicillium malachiteum]
MKSTVASLFLTLAATTAGLQITSPSQGECVDLSQGFPVTWTSVEYFPISQIMYYWKKGLIGSPSTDPSTITFRLTNYNGASPPIDEPYPPSRNVLVSTSEGTHSFPGVSNDVAHGLATINNGNGFEIWIVSPVHGGALAQSQQFRLASPGGSCAST